MMQAKRSWRSKALVIGVGFFGLVVGLGIEAPDKGQTKTVTQIESKTTTQIAANTHTVVPESCAAAITDARHLATIITSAFDHASDYIPLIARAASAGAEEDAGGLESVNADEKHVTSKIEGDTTRVTHAAAHFNEDASSCHA